MRLFRTVSAYFAMAQIFLDVKEGDLVALRSGLDRFLDKYTDDYPFMLAFDASLMFAEERNEEAKARLKRCLEVLPDDGSSDSRYISLYCQRYDFLLDESRRNALSKEAEQLQVDRLIKSFLRFPSEARMKEIVEEARRDATERRVSFDF